MHIFSIYIIVIEHDIQNNEKVMDLKTICVCVKIKYYCLLHYRIFLLCNKYFMRTHFQLISSR